jgi:hypothetical protein
MVVSSATLKADAMKKLLPTVSLLFCISLFSFANGNQAGAVVCEGDVTLSSQAEVDAFECTEVTGFLRIAGSDIANLDALSELVRVGGLQINDNDNLTNVDGLSSLEVITGTGGGGDPEVLVISGNPALLNLDGLSTLTTISGIVRINDNASLETINGFSLITEIEILTIEGNPALTSINGFGNVISMSVLSIRNNASLKNLDGFSSLQEVTGRRAGIFITNNASLENIDGLSSLTTIDGSPNASLDISENPSLRNINGLSSLSLVSGFPAFLSITSNLVLENIDGLSALQFLFGGSGMPHITIANNPLLSRCCGLYPFLSATPTQTGATLENNGAGCTVEDILAGGPCPQSVSGFSLINEGSGAVVEDFYDAISLDRADPDFFKWTIQANTFPEHVGSVVFRIDGKRKHTENVFPYTLPKSVLSSLKPGTHTLVARVYTKPHKRGAEGIARTAVIEVINSSAILNFEVVDKAGNVLMELKNGDKINSSDPTFRAVSIRANTTSETVGSVKFKLNHRYHKIENSAPYALFGDRDGKYATWDPKPGNYKLVATPYSRSHARGYAGESLKIHFSVVEEYIDYEEQGTESANNASHRGEGASVSVYPVPVEGELHVKTGNLDCRNVLVTIRDIYGQPVFSGTYAIPQSDNYSISTLGFRPGVYYLQIQGDNGFGKVIKFVKR